MSLVPAKRTTASAHRTTANLNYHTLFRIPPEEILPRDDIPGFVHKDTFIRAIMAHPLHQGWFGVAEGDELPIMHKAISGLITDYKNLFFNTEGISKEEAWDDALAQTSNRSLKFLHNWYGEKDFTYSNLQWYSIDPQSGRLLFNDRPVPFNLSEMYDNAVEVLTDAHLNSGGTLSKNEIIEKLVTDMMKTELWLRDSPRRFISSSHVRGGFMYALSVDCYPSYNFNNFNITSAISHRWWPSSFGYFNIGSAIQTLLCWVPSLTSPPSTVNNSSTRNRKRSMACRREDDDNQLHGCHPTIGRREIENDRPTKRRRYSTGHVAAAYVSAVPATVSVKAKKLPDASTSADDDKADEGSEGYSDYWSTEKKSTTARTQKRKRPTCRSSIRTSLPRTSKKDRLQQIQQARKNARQKMAQKP